jgi:outer membrane murein-binding lipoprotein Lpp
MKMSNLIAMAAVWSLAVVAGCSDVRPSDASITSKCDRSSADSAECAKTTGASGAQAPAPVAPH